MKSKLTYGDKLIIARNQNEIKELIALKKCTSKNIDTSILELIKQNREILGRD